MGATIEVRSLGKKYRIGVPEQKADTLFGTILNGIRSPLINFNKISSLSKLDRDEDSIFWALRSVTFSVDEGEVIGIIGHNGAGKSTLLKILSRITEPNEGEVWLRGRVAALLEVGTGFHPELTGRENIYLNGTILGMRKVEIQSRLDEIIEFSGVERFLDTPVKFYSSGMRVRLGFAVAAHIEPETLIIDEVLAVGDIEFQQKCLKKMESVSKRGRTVIFVSHDMAAISALCDKAILLDKGQIMKYGEVSDVVSSYLSSANNIGVKLNEPFPLNIRHDSLGFELLTLEILSDDQIASITTGRRITFRLRFDCSEHSVLANLDIALTIKSRMGEKIFVIDNFHTKERLKHLVRGIEFNINNFPLLPGSYKLDVWMACRGTQFIFLKDRLEFIVDQTNYLGNSKIKTSDRHGYFFVDYEMNTFS